jgi:ABC-type uncharacterized transport system fused permease/ATPase subunit
MQSYLFSKALMPFGRQWGELQALTFARLVLASPRFAFLDDPARSIEAPLAERLYQALRQSSITYLSAGYPPALLPHHDLQLELRQDGSWQVEPVKTDQTKFAVSKVVRHSSCDDKK